MYSKVKSQGRSARPQSFQNMFKDSRQGTSPDEKPAKSQVKRTASVGSSKKGARPHKTSKHHHAVAKKVTGKTNSDKTPTPTPANDAGAEVEPIKDNFWQDLEDGKINVFGSDLYTKVKGSCRAARPKSFENMFKIRQPRPKKTCKESAAQVSSSHTKAKQERKCIATATEFVDLTAADGDVSNSSESSDRSSPEVKAEDSVGLPVVNLGLRVDLGDSVGHPDDVDDKRLSHRVKRLNSDGDFVNSKSQSAAKCDDTRSDQGVKKSNKSLLMKNSSELSADVSNDSPTIVDQVGDVDSNDIVSRVVTSVDSNDNVSRMKSAPSVESNDSVSRLKSATLVDSNNSVSSAESVIPLDSNNRASNMKPVPSDTGSPPVSSPPAPAAMTAPSSESCTPPAETHPVNNNTLSCTDPYKADANAPSSGTDLSAGSKHISMHTDQGIAESPDETYGVSASLTSLIDLNARHLVNETKRAEVSSGHPWPSTCSTENPVPRMLLTDCQKSNAVPVGHVVAVARPVEATRSAATTLTDYAVPDISTILPRSNSKRQMSFEDCTTPVSSLVDWGIGGSTSVFQMNGAVNGAASCPTSSGLQGLHDMPYPSMVDYTQDVDMDDVRSLYSFVNPQSRDSSVDDNHTVTKKIRIDDTRNPGATMPSGLDSILAADFINEHMVESMREIVRNTRSKPQGHSKGVQSSPSSGERNTGNLQHQVGDGPYDSSERRQDIDERIAMNVQAGIRQEYLPSPQQAVEPGNVLFLRRQYSMLWLGTFCVHSVQMWFNRNSVF